MKKNYKYVIGVFFALILMSCEKDNFDSPNAILEGQIVYEDFPLSVRSNSAELELWQDGFALDEFIPVFIAQDGTYSASLFDGEYKMVRKGGDPWLPQLNDTLIVNVTGNTQFDVPVTPYFTIRNESFEQDNNMLTASFQINQIVESSNIQSVRIIIGDSYLVDQNINDYLEDISLDDVNLGGTTIASINIPENLRDLDYIFVRIGVNSSSSNELIYTNSQRIDL